MVIQIALGSFILLISVALASLAFWAMERAFRVLHPWLVRPPHRAKLSIVICAAALVVFAQVMASVGLWAATYRALSLVPDTETAVYVALQTFTTLGFGDILLPREWRLLSGMASINGLLNVGLMTALMIEAARHVRQTQIDTSRRK